MSLPDRMERRALYIKDRLYALSRQEEKEESEVKLDISVFETEYHTSIQKIQSIDYRIFHHDVSADFSIHWKKKKYARLLEWATHLLRDINNSRVYRDWVWRKLLRRSRGDIRKKLFEYKRDISRKRKLVDISLCQICIVECKRQISKIIVDQIIARELRETGVDEPECIRRNDSSDSSDESDSGDESDESDSGDESDESDSSDESDESDESDSSDSSDESDSSQR